jgi:membrane protease YdiL (CAAX protease family)
MNGDLLNKPASIARRYQLGAYFALTFACFWLATPLAAVSIVLPGLVASFAPALVAFLLTAIFEGRAGTRTLGGRLLIWRVGFGWYLAAAGIPVAASLLILLASLAFGAVSTAQPGQILAYIPVIFFLAAGEEFGWRGYVLPRLLRRFPPLAVALLLGIIHAAYHLPLWVAPGFPSPSYSLAAFSIASLAFGVIWTWLYQNTRGSVLIATLFHGAINSAGNLFFPGIPPALLNWLLPAVFSGAAAMVIVASGSGLKRTQTASTAGPTGSNQ